MNITPELIGAWLLIALTCLLLGLSVSIMFHMRKNSREIRHNQQRREYHE